MGRGSLDNQAAKVGGCATFVCLVLFFSFFFGLNYPEVQVETQFVKSKCTVESKSIVPYRSCFTSCSSCAETGARSCGSFEVEDLARDRFDLSATTLSALQQTCGDGFFCCQECCDTCQECSTDSKGKRTCRDKQCNCRCCDSVDNRQCNFRCTTYYETRIVMSLPQITDDQLRGQVAAGDRVTVPVVKDFTSDEAGAREFLNRPDFALNSTSPCAYSPEVILTNGVTVDADAIVVGDDLGYSPGYWVLLAFPSMYFFVLLAACVFTAVKAKTDDDNAGVGAACCCCLGLFLPLVVLLPIALDSAVPAADRENLVVAIVVFSLLFAGIPMVCGCLYVTWHAFGNSIKNNAIQEKLGVALGGGVYQEMWKKEFPGFTPQLQSKCETAFEALDEDADGNVQASELINVMKSLGMNPKLPAVNAFLAKADTDGDGKVSVNEFRSMLYSIYRDAEAKKSCGDLRVWKWEHWRDVNKAKMVLSFVFAVVNLTLAIQSTATFADSTEVIESLVSSWKIPPVNGLQFVLADGEAEAQCPSGFEPFPLGPSWDGEPAACDCRQRTCLMRDEANLGQCLPDQTAMGCVETEYPGESFNTYTCLCPEDCDRTLQDDTTCGSEEIAQGCVQLDAIPAQTLTHWRGNAVCVRSGTTDAATRSSQGVGADGSCKAGWRSCASVGTSLESQVGADCFEEGEVCPVTDVRRRDVGGGWDVESDMELSLPVIQFLAAVRLTATEDWVAAYVESEDNIKGEDFDLTEFQLRDERSQQDLFIDNGIPGRLADPEVSYAIGLRREQSWANGCPVTRERLVEVVPGIDFIKVIIVGMVVVLSIDVVWWCVEYMVKDATDEDPRLFRKAEKRLVFIFCTADTVCYGANLPLVLLGATAAGVVSTTLNDAIPCVTEHNEELVATLQAVADHATKLASSTTTILVLKGLKFVLMSPLVQFLLNRCMERLRTKKTVTDTINLVISESSGEDGGHGAVAVVARSDEEDPPFATFYGRTPRRIERVAAPLAAHVSPDEVARPFNTIARGAARVPEPVLAFGNMRLVAIIGRHGAATGGINGVTCAYCRDDDAAHDAAARYLAQPEKLRQAMDSLGKDIDADVRADAGLFVAHTQLGDANPPNGYNAVIIPPGGAIRRLEMFFGMHSKHTLEVFWADSSGTVHEARFGPPPEAQERINATHPVIEVPEDGTCIVGLFGSVGTVSRTLNVLGAYFV